MPSSTELRRAYAFYNKRYFEGQLPDKMVVKWSRSLKGYGCFNDNGIRLAYWMKSHWMLWNITLLHEMAHVATDSEKAEHGPRWNREMHRLARIGAFDKLW